MLEQAGADVAFIPSAHDMYGSGFNTWVEVKGITERLEGAVRDGHFRGVTTVCNKLFNIVQAHAGLFRAEGRPAGAGDKKRWSPTST